MWFTFEVSNDDDNLISLSEEHPWNKYAILLNSLGRNNEKLIFSKHTHSENKLPKLVY